MSVLSQLSARSQMSDSPVTSANGNGNFYLVVMLNFQKA